MESRRAPKRQSRRPGDYAQAERPYTRDHEATRAAAMTASEVKCSGKERRRAIVVRAEWAEGRPTEAWDQLWARIFAGTLSHHLPPEQTQRLGQNGHERDAQ